MKRVLVLEAVSGNEAIIPYAKVLNEKITSYNFTQLLYDQLLVELSPDSFLITFDNGRSIEDFDLTLFRESGGNPDLAYVVGNYLERKGKPFLNHNYLTYRPASKLAQLLIFHDNHANFPKTYFSLDHKLLVSAAAELGYPYILKDTFGRKGIHNYLINSVNEAEVVLNRHPAVKFIAQAFIPNNGDYRVLVMGDTEPMQIKRVAAGESHLNNTSAGAKADIVSELSDEIILECQKLAKIFNLSLAGVDVMKSESDHKYYYLEVNSLPQITTGVEIEMKMKKFKNLLDDLLQ